MSLIELMMETFTIMDKTRTSDGEGGYTTSWTDGADILCALVNDISMSSRTAEKQGVTSTYTVTTKRANKLEYHDVIKRKRDGKTFRITSDGSDKLSPDSSTLDMSQATAEAFDLT